MSEIDGVQNSDMLMELTAEVVAAYVSKNSLPVSDLPSLILDVHSALSQAGVEPPAPQAEKPKPAVSVKRSVTDDYIVCLEDGKKFKSLKRHLMTHYNMSPEDYREKWDLPSDYPMVAPNYAAARSRLAKQMGLGYTRRRARG
ncbi:Ros/MucR family transcriptional regulator [Aureimonas ureilytica]|uniref:MucR family transcriptional regulator n=1 Tax=Aureimonas ureilytica TaxID=401562 RepID=UPI0003703BF9|nr:MucR family transcriptional regulator [Aureimonas ureilytica]